MQTNKKQYLKIFPVLFFFLCGLFAYSTIPSLPCSHVKKGHFYFYAKSTGNSYKIIRLDSLQMEISSKTKDTSFWKIRWTDDCSYVAHYLHGGGDHLATMKDFLLQHSTCIQIREVKPEFYIFKVSLDSFNSKQFAIDTAWMKAK